MLPFAIRRPEEVLPYASLVEWTPVARLWAGQSTAVDPFHAMSHLAGAGIRIPVGMAVTLMPLRHPYDAAVQAMSLARVTGHPASVGFGPGAPGFQERMLGAPYASALTATRDYLTIVRGLVRGDEVDHPGAEYQARASITRHPRPSVEIGGGVLRAGMARTIGEVGDFAVTWLAPAPYIGDVLVPAMSAGAHRANRPTPRVVATIALGLAKGRRTAADMALASSGQHLGQPHYREMLGRAGLRLPGTSPEDDAGVLAAGGGFCFGSARDVGDVVGEFAAAGADEVVLNLSGTHNRFGSATAFAELRQVLDVLL